MATATGTYATLADAKLRLGFGTATTTDDTLLQDLCDQVNGWVEASTGRPIAPYAGTYTFDGYDALDQGTFQVRRGIVSLDTLEIAGQTGGTFSTIPAGDYFLSPASGSREPGWPAFRVVLTDAPVASNPYPYFPSGYQNVRMAGTFGWSAIPDELVDVALTVTQRAWHARQAGEPDVIGTSEYGAIVIDRDKVPGRLWGILSRFKFKLAP